MLEAITADISGLKLGESLRIADLKLLRRNHGRRGVIVAIVEAPVFPAGRLRLLKNLREISLIRLFSFYRVRSCFAAPFCRQQGIFGKVQDTYLPDQSGKSLRFMNKSLYWC
ncbi:MAG: hypothetical protein ACLT38_09935 [Akkermansia sp.]